MSQATVALITNKRVVNVVVCDYSEISIFKSACDIALDVTNLTILPALFCYYNQVTNTFSPPPTLIIDELQDQSLITLGSNISFEPFNIENYSVVQYGRFVAIGCMQFNIDYIRNIYNQLLNEGVPAMGVFSTDGTNVYQTVVTPSGDSVVFSITNPDALTILQALQTLTDEVTINSQS
jgi:hypothetical protein